MSDALREEIADGAVKIELEPVSGGEVRLAAFVDGDAIESGEYTTKVFSSPTVRGQFLNSVEESLERRDGVDADAVRVELKEWLTSMNELDREEQAAAFLPAEINQIIDGTEAVEVHGGETTTWHVTLTFAGRTREMEFTASEIVSSSGKALQEKVANQFFEFVEIDQEDWVAIRERWQERKEVVDVVESTGRDAVVDRLTEYLGDTLIVVDEREKMGNDPAACWFDEANDTMTDVAPPDASIVWVQDRFLVDQLTDRVGKSVEDKPMLIKALNQRGVIYGVEADGRKKWAWSKRTKVYAFRPEALGVDPDDVGGGTDPAHSEVEA